MRRMYQEIFWKLKMKKYVYCLALITVLSACNGDSVSRMLELNSNPKFVSATQNFRFMEAHPVGALFELFETPQGERFVMTHTKNSATLVMFTPVPMNLEYGLMLDSKLCSTGLVAHRQKNWPVGTYGLNITASPYSNVKVAAPTGVCFKRVD